jgi:dipeptidyl aminopeptidase/acylaminoacyl peptidase
MPQSVRRRSVRRSTWLVALPLSALVAIGASEVSGRPSPVSFAAPHPPAGRALTIEDYYRIPTVGSPDLSPDGRFVAFTVSTRVEETNGSRSEVWLVAADGASPARRLSAEGANATGVQWSDSSILRFNAAGKSWTVNPSTPGRMTESDSASGGRGAAGGRGGRGGGATGGGGRGGAGGGGGGGGAALRSRDGTWTAAVRTAVLPPKARAPLTDFEKRHEDRFKGVQFDWLDFRRDGGPFPVPNASDPDVSPPQEIFVTPAAGGAARQITHLGLRPNNTQWNHEGTAVIFTADSAFRDERSYARTDIWMATVDGTVRKLTPDPHYSYSGPRLSPDGRWILYTRSTPTGVIISQHMDNGGPDDLVVIPAGGGRETVLTADWDYLPSGPMWSPDSKYVYFSGGIGGTTHFFRVSPADSRVEQITNGERRISGLNVDRDFTKMAFLVGRFEAPSEISIANIDGTGERQLTHILDAFTKDVTLGTSERLNFKSADGTPVEGWLLYPYGYRADGGPYPLIVSNHGGPHSAVEYGFDFKSQYFAANGYLVLQVNFRSSTGYGEQFLWATWGAWGTRDGQDVMAGVDYVIEHFRADRNHVATIGHSYGGFMSNWLIGQYPDRFAAACVGAGISDWLSDYGLSDIPQTKETEFYGPVWDPKAREIMIRQSPVMYADRVKAATLFIHGSVDHRVPFEEGEQMYFALKRNGVPAKMIQYENQPHGIAGNWNLVHRMLHEREWLDTYLKGKRAR